MIAPDRIRLLVSVRSAAEAAAALSGGADLIDVKEPGRGSLGRADVDTIAAVVQQVAGRRPVSAALGELIDEAPPMSWDGLALVKWGLAGCGADWHVRLATRMAEIPCGVVPVIYADWQRAAAPLPRAIAAFARENRCAALLFDTWRKDGTTLFDWLSVAEIQQLREVAGVPIALAGSLGLDHLRPVRTLAPDWLAVRGAVCRGGRNGVVEAARVARLASSLNE